MNKEYKLFVKNLYQTTVQLTPQTTIIGVCKELLNRLQAVNALSVADGGEFITTKNPFKKYNTTKRYCVRLLFPCVDFTIVKLTKGDIPQEELIETIRILRRKYEGI